MENPQNKIMRILDINEKIKRNIFSISFKDQKIEKEYIETEIKINIKIKLILHLSYILNFVIKIANGRFRSIMYTTIIQAMFAAICLISIIGYHFSKNTKLKKFFDYSSAYISYIYQVIFSIQIYKYPDLSDTVHASRSQSVLTYLSSLEILFSFESSIIMPFFILTINIITNILVLEKFDYIQGNNIFILIGTFCIFACIIFKRYIIELNRLNFIQQFIFKKYSLYYYDLIDNMNGFQFTMRKDIILKYNQNFKSEILNYDSNKIKNTYNNCEVNLNEKYMNEQKNEKNDDSGKNLFEVSKVDEGYANGDLYIQSSTKKNLLKKYKKFENVNINENEYTINFLKSLKIKDFENNKLCKFTQNEASPSLYEIYCLIKKDDFIYKQSNEHLEDNFKKTNIEQYKFDNDEIKYNQNNKNNLFNIDILPLKKFICLGEFERTFDKNIYQVYFRKLQEYDNLIDFSIYNITKIKEAERLKAEDELKDQFFAKIAHEFKTPINSILGLISKIKCKLELFLLKENDKIKYEINQVENLSNYTIFLIHDIIDYSKNNKKVSMFNFKREKLDIKEIIEFCKGILETLLISKGKEKSIKIEINIDKKNFQRNFYAYSDTFRIKQILLNFISNSVKFTKSGFIRLNVELAYMENKIVGHLQNKSAHNSVIKFSKMNNRDEFLNKSKYKSNIYSYCRNEHKKVPHLIISVIDSGMGISDSELKNISEEENAFMRKDYNIEGSGLGLSISKFFAKALNHKIKVCSEVGKGSEFSLILNCKSLKKNKLEKYEIGYYSEREKIIKSDWKNSMIEKFKSLNQSFYHYSNDFIKNYKNEFDLFSNNQNDGKSILEASKYSDFSIPTNKLENLNLKFNKEDLNQFSQDKSFSMKNFFSQSELNDYNITNKNINSNNFYRKIIKNRTINPILKNSKFEIDKIKDDINFSYSHRSSSKISIQKELNSVQNNSNENTETLYFSYAMQKPSFLLNRNIKDNFPNQNNKEEEKYSFLGLVNDNMNNYMDTNNHDLNNFYNSVSNESELNYDNFKNEESYKNNNKCNKIKNIILNVKKYKILIIDDHKIIRESLVILIKKILKNLNKENIFDIIEGSDGVDILSYLIYDQTKENEIKLVITDENMEYINGSEAISIIRKLEKAKKIKNVSIASITAFEDEFNKNKIKQSGSNIILSKPCSESMLRKFLLDYKILE